MMLLKEKDRNLLINNYTFIIIHSERLEFIDDRFTLIISAWRVSTADSHLSSTLNMRA
jgi:hypothetical protein